MPFIDDDQLVEAFLTDSANPAFGVGIGIWSTNGRVNHFDVLCDKNVIEGGSELGVPIME